jgi:hypothetical protein
MTRIRSLAALAGAAALAAAAACEKDGPQDITGAVAPARVKFFNFGVGAPGVNFYANDTKMTAVSSTDTVESTNGTAYGSAGAGGFYSGLPAGQYTFTARIAAATDKNLVVATIPSAVADGKAYSVFLSGNYDATAKRVDGFVLEDNYATTFVYDSAYVRFVNASSTAGPVRLFFRSPTTPTQIGPVSPAVAYKAGGPFVAFPITAGTAGFTADLVVRTETGTADLVVRTAVGFSPGRVYTVALRGDITVTSTTAANRPQLDVTANR